MKRKLLSLLLVLALALSIIPAQALAASYPSMIPRVTENSYTIPQGETGYFEFTIFHEYWNECYNVAVYDSYGSKVASVYKYLYDTPPYDRCDDYCGHIRFGLECGYIYGSVLDGILLLRQLV